MFVCVCISVCVCVFNDLREAKTIMNVGITCLVFVPTSLYECVSMHKCVCMCRCREREIRGDHFFPDLCVICVFGRVLYVCVCVRGAHVSSSVCLCHDFWTTREMRPVPVLGPGQPASSDDTEKGG